MSMYVINIFYRDKKTPPETLVDITNNDVRGGIFTTVNKEGLVTGIPLDIVERFEIVEEDSVEV